MKQVKKIALRLLLAFVVFVVILIVNLIIFSKSATNISEGVPIENRDPERVALLIIDIQEGTTGEISATDGLIRQSESLIEQVNGLAAKAEDKGWSIVWIRTEVSNPLLNILNNTLAKGSLGAELDRRLDTSRGMVLVKKKSDSFANTQLDQFLEEQRIGQLVIAGLAADRCVLSTIKAAANRGYPMRVFEETVIAENEAGMPEILETYKELGVEVLTMK